MPDHSSSLNLRDQKVLSAVIQQFIASAAPVSSKFIASLEGMNVSSATVRNSFAKLEKLGFLEQMHTSAGRQPTDYGYRQYLNSLENLGTLSLAEQENIKSNIIGLNHDTDLLHLTSEVLSRITNLIGIAASPFVKSGVLEFIKLVPLAETKVMLVVSLSGGLVRSLVVELDVSIPERFLNELNRVINEKISGLDVSKLNNSVIDAIESSTKVDFKGPIRIFTRSILKLVQSPSYDKVYISGAQNLIKRPEFEKIEDIEGIIELLEDKKTLVHFLQRRKESSDVTVTIGREHKMGIFKTHSVITSSYTFNGVNGTLGVIGPMRMDYSKFMSVVGFAAEMISHQDGVK